MAGSAGGEGSGVGELRDREHAPGLFQHEEFAPVQVFGMDRAVLVRADYMGGARPDQGPSSGFPLGAGEVVGPRVSPWMCGPRG